MGGGFVLVLGRVELIILSGGRLPAIAGLLGGYFRALGRVAGKMRAVADVLQALAAGVAVDQLDRIEIARDRCPDLLVGGVDQPHHQEEAHHRRHEIGEGDLPYAAVMGVLVVAVHAPDDDDLVLDVAYFH